MNENESVKKAPDIGDSLFSNIDYYTLAKDLLKNWWVILLAGITAVLVVNLLPYIPYVGYKPMYTASSTVIVKGTVRSGDSFNTYSSSAEKFAGILTDEYILQEVAEDMGLTRLDVEVDCSIIAETNLLSLSVRSDKPSISYRVIKGLLEHYTDISEMMYPGYVLEELVPAVYPSGPDNSYNVTDLSKKCALITMAAVAVIILLLSWYYDSIKNENDVEKKLDTRLYAAIYHERKYKTLRMALSLKRRRKKTALLISSPLASFGFVESYKRLREKLISRCQRSGRKVILITSMLENEGKSTVAANLALALAGVSQKVVLVDADLRKPAQHKIFECSDDTIITLSEYLRGDAAVSDCLVKKEDSGLYMIYDKTYCPDSGEIAGSRRMKELIDYLRKEMDYIIIDTPPVEMAADAEILTQFADYSLLVINPDHAPTSAVNDCIDRLREGHAKLLGCVLNNICTIPLIIQQMTGIDVAGAAGGGSRYGSYGYGYGYGHEFGYGYGYGSENDCGPDFSDPGISGNREQSVYRRAVSGEDFFAERASRKTDPEEE